MPETGEEAVLRADQDGVVGGHGGRPNRTVGREPPFFLPASMSNARTEPLNSVVTTASLPAGVI